MKKEHWLRTDIVTNIRADKGYYEISSLGNVRYAYLGKYYDKYIERHNSASSKSVNRNTIRVYINKKETQYYVDELVAKYFLGLQHCSIFHKDGDYSNDEVDNLSSISIYKCPGYENEIWVPIERYENLYEISNLGRIRSLEYAASHRIYPSVMLKLTENDKYLYVTLYDRRGGKQQFSVHRLVAYHFLDVPANYRELDINHKDFNTQNNSAENLEWATRLENVRYSSTRGRMDNRKHPESRIQSIIRGYPVYCTTTDKLYLRWTDAENELGLWNGAIKNCLTKGVTSHGYSFRKVDKHSEEYREAFYKEFEKLHPGEDLEDYSKYLESAGLSDLLR